MALLGPPGAFGLLQRAYDAKYGVDLQALGKLAVTQRNHAILNENACEELRVPITIDDYINSRMIADPIRLLDCVMLADGAAGADRDQPEAREGKGHQEVRRSARLCRAHQLPRRRQSRRCDAERPRDRRRRRRSATAGWNIKDVRSFHPYDDFLIALVIQFEAFGFCKPGEGMAFVRDTDLSYNGTLPMNTGGGQISAGQAACSSHNLIEAVRQLMGEAGKRQVKDTTNALVTGIGWINYGRNWGSSAALALVPNQ